MKRKITPCSPDQKPKQPLKRRKMPLASVCYNGLNDDNYLLFEIKTDKSIKGDLLQIDFFVKKKDKNMFENIIAFVPVKIEDQVYRIAVDFIPFVLSVDLNLFFPVIQDNTFFFENTKSEQIVPTVVSKYVRSKLTIDVIDECILDRMGDYGIKKFVLYIRMTILNSKNNEEKENIIDVVKIEPFC